MSKAHALEDIGIRLPKSIERIASYFLSPCAEGSQRTADGIERQVLRAYFAGAQKAHTGNFPRLQAQVFFGEAGGGNCEEKVAGVVGNVFVGIDVGERGKQRVNIGEGSAGRNRRLPSDFFHQLTVKRFQCALFIIDKTTGKVEFACAGIFAPNQ